VKASTGAGLPSRSAGGSTLNSSTRSLPTGGPRSNPSATWRWRRP